ncbi:MAG: ATP-binding protein [Hyphomonadaceae bacterium]|nr:ATP-binding protein [Hyphomonadaceae bacterium]
MSERPDMTVDRLLDHLVEESVGEADVASVGEPARARAALARALDTTSRLRKSGSQNAGKKRRRSVGEATTRSTSGAGFEFEDHIAASLLVRMMAGMPAPGCTAPGQVLQFQTGALGWRIDDLLMSGAGEDGQPFCLALSCKSKVEVSRNGFPTDFVERVYEDRTRLTAQGRGQTKFALATRGRNQAFEEAWADIRGWLSNGVTPLALARAAKHQKHRRVFDSLRLGGAADEDVGALAERVQLIATDFQTADSKDEEANLERCRSLLVTGSWSEARSLWEELLQRAANARTKSGTIRTTELWSELRIVFNLKDHPDLASSWAALRRLSDEARLRTEIALPNGHMVERQVEERAFADLLGANVLCAIHGESGVGKSALAASVLEASFSDWGHVWLGPQELELLLRPAQRASAGLKQALDVVLLGSARANNVLILDAAERLSDDLVNHVRAVADALILANKAENPAWRVVVISQTEAGANVRARLGLISSACLAIDEISAALVRKALWSSSVLSWLGSDEEAVAALGNLSTLSFVMQAEGMFAAQGSEVAFSKTTIADRLWAWWTDGKVTLKRLLMKLAERDANFERSIAISELEGDEAEALDKASLRTPLRINSRSNRVEFVHDMAADWSRYQRLREFAADVEKWALLSANPLWLPALRMLGESLLRTKEGGDSAWDDAFRKLGVNSQDGAAKNILLDALVLDPLAEHYLTERADLLFADNGKVLRRALERFLHVATRPSVPNYLMALDPSLKLYFDAHHREPIIGRWPAMVRFLDARRSDVTALMSTQVARLAEIWLTRVPAIMTNGDRFPFRLELAHLALGTARTLQIVQETERFLPSDGFEEKIYRSAFAASGDLPDETIQWALEMCRRLPLHDDIKAAIAEARRREAQRRRDLWENDPEYRKRQQEIRAMPRSLAGLGRHKMPPWPLGPTRRVERDFRDTCLHKGVLNGLMKDRPLDAGEILLACIIDDEPEEETRDYAFDRNLGLAYDHDAYPTIYWTSPFLTFFWMAPDGALSRLMQLVDFCTERWAEPARGAPPGIDLDLGDGVVRRFVGNNWVFDWCETNSNRSGQLFCSLSALEFWLCVSLDAGQDVSAYLDRLLRETSSAAVLGVLINVGKHRPSLFEGVLKPLLGHAALYRWDEHRVENNELRFNVAHWARHGEHMFELAKAWALAPRRKTTLGAVAFELLTSNEEMATFLKEATKTWVRPEDEKLRLELEILAVRLDRSNYERDGEGWVISLPAQLQQDIAVFQEAHASKRRDVFLPMQALRFLERGVSLTDKDSQSLADLLMELDETHGEAPAVRADGTESANEAVVGRDEDADAEDDAGENELSEERASHATARIAAASTLIARGQTFLQAHRHVEAKAHAVIDELLDAVAGDAEGLRHSRITSSGYEFTFAAYAVLTAWLERGDSKSSEAVLRLISSRQRGALSTLVAAARRDRAQIGKRFEAIMGASLLWSALSALAPRYGADEAQRRRWERWVARFRKMPIDRLASAKVDLVDLAARVARVGDIREERSEQGRHRRKLKLTCFHTGLDNEALYQIYSDILDFERSGSADTAEDREAAATLWKICLPTVRQDADRDGEYSLPDKLGYDVLQALARMAAFAPPDEAKALWADILKLGPPGHYAVDHFLNCFFIQAHVASPEHFVRQWRQMAEFMLSDATWTGDKLWYRRESCLRIALGFAAHRSLKYLLDAPKHVASLWDVFVRWANEHLGIEEDNIAAFANFLASEVGRDIRMRASALLGERIEALTDRDNWRRDRAGAALVDFADVLVTQHGAELRANKVVLGALIRIVAALVTKNTTGALVLQERIRDLK